MEGCRDEARRDENEHESGEPEEPGEVETDTAPVDAIADPDGDEDPECRPEARGQRAVHYPDFPRRPVV